MSEMIPRLPALRASLAALLLAGVTGCAAADGGVRVQGPAPSSIPWSGPVYALSWESQPLVHPELMDLTDYTVLDDMTWHGWGSPRATATGWVILLDCTSTCPAEPPGYRVTIAFGGLAKRQYAAYYSWAAVLPAHGPAPAWAEDVRRVPLHVPTR